MINSTRARDVRCQYFEQPVHSFSTKNCSLSVLFALHRARIRAVLDLGKLWRKLLGFFRAALISNRTADHVQVFSHRYKFADGAFIKHIVDINLCICAKKHRGAADWSSVDANYGAGGGRAPENGNNTQSGEQPYAEPATSGDTRCTKSALDL
jgi:hypothetical protein